MRRQQVMVRLSQRQVDRLREIGVELAHQDLRKKELHEPTILERNGHTNVSATIRRALYKAYPDLEKLA